MKTIRIGRNWDQDYSIRDDSVSRRHAELVMTNKEWVLTDLKTTNGTYLVTGEEKQTVGSTIVTPEDRVYFGAVGPYLIRDIIESCSNGNRADARVELEDPNRPFDDRSQSGSVTNPVAQGKKRCVNCAAIIARNLERCPHCHRLT